MNDPGFDATTEEVAKDLENNEPDQEDVDDLQEEEYLESRQVNELEEA